MPADVPHRGVGAAPLVERTGRLALEVDDEPLPARPQHLPQMQVAVDALGRWPGVAGGQRAEGGPQTGYEGLERRHAVCRGVQPLGHRLRRTTALAVRTGREGRGQCEVHLRRGLPQLVCLRGEVVTGGERAQRQRPAVRRVAQIRLEHAQRRLLRLCRPEPGHRRGHPAAALSGQRARHLQVRVDTGLDAPEQLQDELVAVHQRGVGLLGVQQPRRQPGGHRRGRVALEPQGTGRTRMPQPLQEQLRRPGSCSASYTVMPANGPCSARPMSARPRRGDGCCRTPSSSW